MTLLIVPIAGHDIAEVRDRVERAVTVGADAIELRVDRMGELSSEALRALRLETPRHVPFILTIRSAAEGGAWDGNDDDRVSRLIELGPFVEYIDVELALWRRSANIRQKIELALHRADRVSQEGGREEIEFAERRRLILSCHDTKSRPQTMQSTLVEMFGEPACTVAKLAWRARSIRDNFEALEHEQIAPKPAMLLCMGDDGLMSRVLAKKVGAFGTFASLERGQESAPGQPTIAELKELYRWDAIDADTALFGVIGDPVAHSLSPRMHNAAFAALGLNALFLPMHVNAGYESFKAFMLESTARRWLHFRGCSVTIPHKEDALRFCRAQGAAVDERAARIGAVNTLVLDAAGNLSAFNTDYDGARACIEEALAAQRRSSSGAAAAVLGAGGVARAAVAALVDLGADVTIFNRTEARGRALADEFGCRCAPWDARITARPDLVVNCTSIGMRPADEERLLSPGALAERPLVFDTVYRDGLTALISEARAAGCPTIDGRDLLLRQGMRQFQLWTGHLAPQAVMSRAVSG